MGNIWAVTGTASGLANNITLSFTKLWKQKIKIIFFSTNYLLFNISNNNIYHLCFIFKCHNFISILLSAFNYNSRYYWCLFFYLGKDITTKLQQVKSSYHSLSSIMKWHLTGTYRIIIRKNVLIIKCSLSMLTFHPALPYHSKLTVYNHYIRKSQLLCLWSTI